MRIFGIILVVVGILAFIVPNISFTRKEKVLDIGPIEAVTEKRESFPVSPLLGVTALAAGAAMIVASVITGKK